MGIETFTGGVKLLKFIDPFTTFRPPEREVEVTLAFCSSISRRPLLTLLSDKT